MLCAQLLHNERATGNHWLGLRLTGRRSNSDGYGARVTVTGRAVDVGVDLTVTDDGPGVPAEHRSGVFEPGRRADPTDGHDGAGLGLALAHRLAVAAGGCLELGENGPGAAFVVHLPAG